MPTSIPRATIRKSLADKGFRSEEGSKHQLWYLWVDDKKTSVRTKLSRGTKYRQYGNPLLNEMKRDLKLPGLSATKRLLKCPITGAEYLAILRAQDIRL